MENRPTNDHQQQSLSEEAITSARVKQIGNDLELVLWSDGSLDIEHWMNKFLTVSQIAPDDPAAQYVHLPQSQARRLRKFLNKPATMVLLGIVPPEPQQIEIAQAVNLGSHALTAWQDHSITIAGNHGVVQLSVGEAYRLLVTLTALFQE
jgi:hypothetical protein